MHLSSRLQHFIKYHLYVDIYNRLLLLLGYNPIQHIAVQINTRSNQGQKKMMPSRDMVNRRYMPV